MSLYKFITLLLLFFMHTSCASNTPDRGKPDASATGASQTEDSLWWKQRAETMVNKQIVSRGIKDKKVIDALKNTPRHEFVPENMVSHAYDDSPLPIGNGQTISQPYIVALMTELLKLKGNEKVLEIGTGSGYQAAVLAPLVDTVYTIELVKPLAETAISALKRLSYNNVVAKQGDGYKGWPEHAPFDHVIITAAPEEIPQELINQLKIGGRMVVPVGKLSQDLLVITKTKNGIRKENIIPVRFVPMVKPE